MIRLIQMGSKSQLTIATVTFNCLEYTKLFLESLRKFTDVPFRLIVVDNHSTDGTAEFLSRQKGIEIIFNKRNLGFGWANNQAFAHTKTPYFLGINNDTFIFPGFLGRLLKIAESQPDYVEFGVHSNCIAAKDPRTNRRVDKGLKALAAKGYSPKRVIKEYYGDYGLFFRQFSQVNRGLLEFEVPPNFIGGWCFLVRTEAVNEAGGLFDRRFRVGFWEDVDLSWRLAKRGGKIALAKDVYLHHFTHISYKENKLRQSDKSLSRSNALRFVDKWNDEIRSFLENKLKKGINLEKIVRKYFIFRVFFGKERDDFPQLQNELETLFLKKRKISFKEFLLRNPRKEARKKS